MAWLRIDTGFARHRKVGRLAYAERWHHLETMCWCAEMGTDGRIEEVDLAVIWPGMPPKVARGIADNLTGAGVWDEHPDGGWQVHDWSDYNISAEAAKEKRERDAERKRRWKEKRQSGDEETPTATRGRTRRATRSGTREETRQERDLRARVRPDPTPSSREEGRVQVRTTPDDQPQGAAAAPDPEPGAQAPPPDVNGKGTDLVDFDQLAAASPTMRAGIARARAKASASA